MDSMMEDRSEIAFFDVETTVPRRQGQGFTILEFGAILVCPRKLVELESYSTLVRPSHLSLISSLSVRCNGITRDAVLSSPTFAQIAHKVYHILHGRIWAGHNILRFDCARIREAFAQIGMPPPQPKGTIDSLALLTQKFGRRAGDMKMATLATYFGIGQQTHRSLDDVRMNLEVLKYCATVLFLESSLPENSLVPPNAVTRHRAGISSRHGVSSNKSTHSSSSRISLTDEQGEAHPILSLVTCSSEDGTSNLAESDATESGSFNMNSFSDQITGESLGTDISMEQEHVSVSPEFLEPDQVSIPSITASFIPFFRGSQRIQLLHNDACLLLLCNNLKVRFGISTKFTDYAGRPRLSFVVDVPPSLCRVLEASDGVAQRLFADSGSGSEWRPVVVRKDGYFNYPTMRLHIPSAVSGDTAIYATEMLKKEPSGAAQRLIFNRFDAAELEGLINPGAILDAFISLDTYDYQQSAGIRLVAKKLIIHA
ncbi:protein NEN1-like [Cucurbita moschata]|uniref:Protein NEN1-like n=1 Tax=Cucurbita moschata TaxID=3662 RepID=A0A6J1ENM3_CUCMO|nr:protein NEN1-like [Cucurbita moschata]